MFGTVAPLVGAWIEITPKISPRQQKIVAPLVGAWIEMGIEKNFVRSLWSLPLWERGLKYFKKCLRQREVYVAPLVGAWIEIAI